MAQFCSLLGANESCVVAVLPCVKELAADSNQFVRASLASVVMELAPMLGKAATIEHLLPVFLALLKDDFPDVRLNIISKLDQVSILACACPHCRLPPQKALHTPCFMELTLSIRLVFNSPNASAKDLGKALSAAVTGSMYCTKFYSLPSEILNTAAAAASGR